MLSRKVVTRSGRGFRGYFPSKKLNRLVHFESILERDAIHLFENSPEVLSYQEQPTIIYYSHEEVIRKYYPDFELELVDDQVIHAEIKLSLKLATNALTTKYLSISDAYQMRPEHFVVLTEKEIRRGIISDFYQILNNNYFNLLKGTRHAEILI